MLSHSGLNRKRIQNYGTNVINVSNRERVASVALGLLVMYRGIKKVNFFKTAVGGYLIYRGASGNCAVYSKLQRSEYTSKAEAVNIQTSLIVNKPKEEVYQFWRNLENLPLFMKHLKTVTKLDDYTSYWELKIPGNVTTVSWNAEIVKDEEDSLISWRSLEGASIDNAGKIEFRDALGHQGTELRIVITYKPPAGQVGSGLAWLLHPLFKKMLEKDILRFKEYFETGNVPVL